MFSKCFEKMHYVQCGYLKWSAFNHSNRRYSSCFLSFLFPKKAQADKSRRTAEAPQGLRSGLIVCVLGGPTETASTCAVVTDTGYLCPASPATPTHARTHAHRCSHNFLSSPETPHSLFTPRVSQAPLQGSACVWLSVSLVSVKTREHLTFADPAAARVPPSLISNSMCPPKRGIQLKIECLLVKG